MTAIREIKIIQKAYRGKGGRFIRHPIESELPNCLGAIDHKWEKEGDYGDTLFVVWAIILWFTAIMIAKDAEKGWPIGHALRLCFRTVFM
jgi:hypothetical protein